MLAYQAQFRPRDSSCTRSRPAMSSRAADGVRDEIELRGRLAKSDVLAAQKAIVEIARGLADAGEIVIGSGNGEFV